MAAQDFAHACGATLTEEYVPTPTASQPDPQWYIAKMRDLYERDPQLLDPSWRAYFSTESAPPQLRAKRPDIPEGTASTPEPAPASSKGPRDDDRPHASARHRPDSRYLRLRLR